jgi:micrococcal nuclease
VRLSRCSVILVLAVTAVGGTAAALASGAQRVPDTARVGHVVDGDTVELTDGRLVRYIGIDTPEMRRRAGEQWVEDPEPYAREATAANRRLVEGQTVRLEYDVERVDRYGRLLAYVYVGEQMVNAALLAQGAAQLLTIPPNVKYVDRFRVLAAEARAAQRGLWALQPGSMQTPRARSETRGP